MENISRINFYDRRKIKKLSRKKYITNKESLELSYSSSGKEFEIRVISDICYDSEMIVVDKNKYLKRINPYYRKLMKRLIKNTTKLKIWNVSTWKYTMLREHDYLYLVFDNERSFAKAKLLS